MNTHNGGRCGDGQSRPVCAERTTAPRSQPSVPPSRLQPPSSALHRSPPCWRCSCLVGALACRGRHPRTTPRSCWSAGSRGRRRTRSARTLPALRRRGRTCLCAEGRTRDGRWIPTSKPADEAYDTMRYDTMRSPVLVSQNCILAADYHALQFSPFPLSFLVGSMHFPVRFDIVRRKVSLLTAFRIYHVIP